ncbi:hypothetical protein HDU99_001201 [Rhizoclosmatium hyalinum]|nr:hypothetical protein HDU99_001201 [Rhizoclosmatium hyalinum]
MDEDREAVKLWRDIWSENMSLMSLWRTGKATTTEMASLSTLRCFNRLSKANTAQSSFEYYSRAGLTFLVGHKNIPDDQLFVFFTDDETVGIKPIRK